MRLNNINLINAIVIYSLFTLFFRNEILNDKKQKENNEMNDKFFKPNSYLNQNSAKEKTENETSDSVNF